MRMRRLIWVCTDHKGLIVQKCFPNFHILIRPNEVHSLVFLKYQPMLPCSLNIIWVLPRSKDNHGSHSLFEHVTWASAKLHMKKYRILWLSLVRPHKWVRHSHYAPPPKKWRGIMLYPLKFWVSVRLSVCLCPSVRQRPHHSSARNSSYSFRPILFKLYMRF